jgi:hypothetical protein
MVSFDRPSGGAGNANYGLEHRSYDNRKDTATSGRLNAMTLTPAKSAPYESGMVAPVTVLCYHLMAS